ncbi:MAG: ABC transporter substrate-binding protein, partial [Candidatus Saccharibacteria bacterium]|nr:ABC transporter substrate-binding protein [Pseudorhodobacter sp.]
MPSRRCPRWPKDLIEVKMINPLPRSINFDPLVVAEALGCFNAEGVLVTLLPFDTSIPYVAFVQNGQADLAMLDPVETITASLAGANIATVYEVMWNAPEAIGVRDETAYDSVDDLAGTTVGLVSDRDRAFLHVSLSVVGKSIDDVTTVVLVESGLTLAAAIRDGQVSALSGAAPDWISLSTNGIKVRLITPKEMLASPANTFAVNAETIAEKHRKLSDSLVQWHECVQGQSREGRAGPAQRRPGRRGRQDGRTVVPAHGDQ